MNKPKPNRNRKATGGKTNRTGQGGKPGKSADNKARSGDGKRRPTNRKPEARTQKPGARTQKPGARQPPGGKGTGRGRPVSPAKAGKSHYGGRQRQTQSGAPLPPNAMVFQVGPEHGIDLAHFLAESTPGKLSVRAIRRALDQGRCQVNGRAENFGSRKLYRGDLVAFVMPKQEETRSLRFAADRVLFDNGDIIAYDKPPGLPVTPTDAGKGQHLTGLLKAALDAPTAAHRLDADTSGIVLLARSDAALQFLQQAFQDHAVEKQYAALVRGTPQASSTRKSYLLLQEQGTGYERWGSGRGTGAIQAITKWSLERRFKNVASLMKVQPKTGRTHQIRVHFAEAGHPLLGDRIYGDRRDPIFVSRHLLHATGIRFPLPGGGTKQLRSRLPADFQQAMDQLEGR